MKNTVATLAAMKRNGEKISQLTCYDYSTAKLIDAAGINMILVGDSLGMTMQGYKDTLPVTVDEMIVYGRSVVRGCKETFVVVDMPFMSYQISVEQAMQNAGRIMKETGASAVKLEGGKEVCPQIRAITAAGIPVVAHIGMTPQSVNAFGGFTVQGKGEANARRVLEDALAVQEAGAFAVTLECVPPKLSALITKKLDIITIGIGASPECDAQVLVWQDMPSGGGQYNLLTISAPLITGVHLKDSHYRLFARTDAEGRDSYTRELEELVAQLQNCPCIVLWVPFNEGWGQFDAKNAVRLLRRLDPTRLIDHASGWHDQGVSDVKSLHVYFKPYRFKPDKKGRAVVLSEFGGYNLPVAGHTWNAKNFGYRGYQTPEALGEAVKTLYETQIVPACKSGLAADVYTQLSDVEDEVNGFVTYDRRVEKLPEALMRAIARELKGD